MKQFISSNLVLLLIFSIHTATAQDQPLTLNMCIQRALDNNTTYIQSHISHKQAKNDVLFSGSRFLPYIGAGIGYDHTVRGPSSQMYIDPTTGIPVPIQYYNKSWASSAGLQVSQPLVNVENIFNISRNLALEKSARYNSEDTKQTTILTVIEYYYNLLKMKKLLMVQDSTLKSSEESFKSAQIRYEVGSAPKSDVLKARYQLESGRLALIQAQNNLAIAEAMLNHVLGFKVDQKIDIVDDLNTPEIDVGYQEAIQNGFEYHPSLLKGQFDLKAANAVIGESVSQFLPTVSVSYNYNWRHEQFDEIKHMLDTDYNWSANITLSVPLFRGFSRMISVGQAKLSKRYYHEALEQTKRDVALEVKQAYFNLEQAKKTILVTQNAEEAADEDLRLNKEKYRLGAGTMLDLINAQVSYTDAKSTMIQALYDYKYAAARLMKAMGKLEEKNFKSE